MSEMSDWLPVPEQPGILSAGDLVLASRAEAKAAKVRRAPRFRLTDVGNSQRFTEDHEGELIYVPGPGWHVWDGKRWRLDNEGAPFRAAKETAHRLRAEAAAIEDRDTAEKVFGWAVKSESAARIASMVDLARRGERDTLGLVTPLHLLDAQSHLLTVANGTINLRTGRIRKHRPSDHLTRLVNVEYDPSAKCPRWRSFLAEVFDRDQALIRYVQRAIGYSLTGETSEQAFFIAHGGGANGKSVFMETVAEVAGEYASNAASDTFIASPSGSGIPSDLARMRGARLVRVPETEDGASLARQIIKRVTGGDAISARFMYREWFEFVPEFKVWLVTNHLPSVPFADYATWRRIRVLPFRRTFSKAEQDPSLRAKLKAELPGVLAWAAEGAVEWYRDGLGTAPVAAEEATESYRARQDTIGRFLEEETEDDAEARVLKTDLYEGYCRWCGSDGLTPNSRTAFNAAVRERGYVEIKSKRGDRYFRGLKVG